MLGYTDNDWDEDFIIDNGMYQNVCKVCGVHFIGHKRRPHCKVCHDKGAKNWSELSPSHQNSLLNILGKDVIGLIGDDNE